MYDDMLRDKFKLEEKHADNFLEAHEDYARASRRAYQLEEELDATLSMLAFTQRSISFLIGAKVAFKRSFAPRKTLLDPADISLRNYGLRSSVRDWRKMRDSLN
jgi:hypothetical protein